MYRASAFDLRTTIAALLLAGCLSAAPASGQEVFKWVDEEGVTHFGHAATSPTHKLAESARAIPSASEVPGQRAASSTDGAAQSAAKLTLAQRTTARSNERSR